MALSRQTLVQRLHCLMMDTIRAKRNVVKIFTGTCKTAYIYNSMDSTAYDDKCEWIRPTDGALSYTDDVLPLYDMLAKATENEPGVKIAKLSKKATGIRIRFDEDFTPSGKTSAWQRVYESLKDQAEDFDLTKEFEEKRALGKKVQEEIVIPALGGLMCLNAAPGAITEVDTHKKKKGTEMGSLKEDFSLSNLKDAFINKVTHLDRKTVMILAIIALLLLIVGKYQTIKDILIGIKDKVKRSKNFKAMVEDGTNAINSLKKIVGVKDKGDANAEA